MSTMERVTELLKARIERDSPDQMEKAGEIWSELPLNFFYLTHADDTVDIVVTSVAKRVAQEDGITLSKEVLRNLQNLVAPKTIAKDAGRLIFLTTFQPSAKN